MRTSSLTLLLKNITLFHSHDTTDCRIEDGVITAIGRGLGQKADRIVEAQNLIAIPTAMDMHVHFRVPGAEHKENWFTGTAAALAGGVTTVLDMPNNEPPITTRLRLEDKIMAIERTHPRVDYGCYIGATTDNLSEILSSQELACGVKIAPYFVGNDRRALIDDLHALRSLFESPNTLPIVIHCEDEAMIAKNKQTLCSPTLKDHNHIRSESAAISALTRILLTAQGTRAKIHITHVSTKRELELIAQAKEKGMDITCDVTPHHLTFTDEDVQNDPRFKVNPPLRSTSDRDAVWEGMINGSVDMVASDHAPHLLSEKQHLSYDAILPGVPGVQTLLPVLLNKLSYRFSLQRLVELTSKNPRKRFNRRVHTLTVGEPADMVLIDVHGTTLIQKNMLKSKCGWSPWEGRTLTGTIHTVIRKGEIVVH